MDLTSDPHLNKPFGAKGKEVIDLTRALEETVNCEYGNQLVNASDMQPSVHLTLKLTKFEPSPAIRSYRWMNLQE